MVDRRTEIELCLFEDGQPNNWPSIRKQRRVVKRHGLGDFVAVAVVTCYDMAVCGGRLGRKPQPSIAME